MIEQIENTIKFWCYTCHDFCSLFLRMFFCAVQSRRTIFLIPAISTSFFMVLLYFWPLSTISAFFAIQYYLPFSGLYVYFAFDCVIFMHVWVSNLHEFMFWRFNWVIEAKFPIWVMYLTEIHFKFNGNQTSFHSGSELSQQFFG